MIHFKNRKSWCFKETTRFGFIFKFLGHQLFSQVHINGLASYSSTARPSFPSHCPPHRWIFLWQSRVTLELIHPTTREVPVKHSTFYLMTSLISYLFILMHCPFDTENYLMVFSGVQKSSLPQFNHNSISSDCFQTTTNSLLLKNSC